jgi:hypothetical protein
LICHVKAFDRGHAPLCKRFLPYLCKNTRHVAQINGSRP